MIDAFDAGAGFRELIGVWRFGPAARPVLSKEATKVAKKQQATAEKVYRAKVKDDALHQAVLARASTVLAGLGDSEWPPSLAKVIFDVKADDVTAMVEADVVEAVLGPAAPPDEMARRVTAAKERLAQVPYVVVARQDPVMDAFRVVWERWVPTGKYVETEESAASSFREVCRHYPVEEVKQGLLYYIEHVGDPDDPLPAHSMAWVLEKGPRGNQFCYWQHYAHRAKHEPAPEAQAAFDVVWRLYPAWQGREEGRARRDLRDLFLRFVPPADWFPFVCAVRVYRHERRIADDADRAQFTVGLGRFFGRWRAHPWEREAAYLLAGPFWRLAVAPLGPWEGKPRVDWYEGALFFLMHAEKYRLSPLEACRGVEERVRFANNDTVVEPVPGACEAAVAEAWHEVCRLPRGVVASGRAPRSGDSD